MELLAVFALLVGVLVLVASRRSDARAAQGQLSRETRQRNKEFGGFTDADQAKSAPAVGTGKDVERAAVLARRADGDVVQAGAAPPVPWTAPDEGTIGVARRQFLNRTIIGLMGMSLSSFGAATIAFLYGGGVGGGFGSRIALGNITDLKANIDRGNGFFYVPEGRMWVTRYPAGSLKKAEDNYSASELTGMREGVIALYQKCPHLGCRVPECATSQWFECPCHGSKYNRVGERKRGPAPRGLDRFAMKVTGGSLVVDTGAIILGPPIGTNTTGQEAEGPACVGEAEA